MKDGRGMGQQDGQPIADIFGRELNPVFQERRGGRGGDRDSQAPGRQRLGVGMAASARSHKSHLAPSYHFPELFAGREWETAGVGPGVTRGRCVRIPAGRRRRRSGAAALEGLTNRPRLGCGAPATANTVDYDGDPYRGTGRARGNRGAAVLATAYCVLGTAY